MPKGGRSRARRGCLTGLVVVLVLLLAGGVAVYRFDALDRWWPKGPPDPRVEPAAVAPPEGLDLPAPSPAATVAPAEDPDPETRLLPGKVRAAIANALKDRDLGRHVVVDVETAAGTGPAYHYGTPHTFTPASTTKLLTSVAALQALGPDATFDTVVRRGAGDRIVLVGGGDPNLASRPVPTDEKDEVYPPRADVRTLAKQVAASLREQGRTRVRVGYDDTLFTGPEVNPRWEDSYIPDGVVAPITSLWVDEGHDPSGYGRVADPAQVATRAFADALERQGIQVRGPLRPAPARPDAPVLGRVTSAPLSQIVERLLDVSSNEAAEVVARHVGLAVEQDGSFQGAVRGVRSVLAGLGVPVEGSRWYDGSGLSRDNRLTGDLLLEVLRVASADEHPRLRAAITGMPIAGFTGSLTGRFAEGDPAGLGRIRAKTGTLIEGGVHGLAGYVTDATGAPLLFVVVADKVKYERTLGARDAVDEIAAEIAACACTTR